MAQLTRPLVIVAALALQLVWASQAHAIAIGLESNGRLVNSDATPAIQSAELDRIKELGASVVRVNFGWNELAGSCSGQSAAALENPDNACYTWGVLDSLVALAQARGIQVLLSTSRAPAWLHASADPMYLGTTSAEFDHTVEQYAAFMKAAATRYNGASGHGSIRLWTVWNEPNGDVFWHPLPDARRYAQLYAATAVAIKTANASALVAPGPTAPKGYRTTRALHFIRSFQAWIGTYMAPRDPRQYIDAWAHNPYPGMTSAWSSGGATSTGSIYMQRINQLLTLLDESSVTRGVKVWATEFGWQTNPPDTALGISPARQAQFIPEGYHWLDTRPGRRITIGIHYGVTDPGAPADWQSGMFTSTGSTKPSFFSFQRMISIPRNVVRRGQYVNIWARSNVAPAAGRLVFRAAGTTRWYLLPGVRRRSDGTMTARVRITRARTQFAVWDPTYTSTYGPARTVIAR